MSRELKEVHGIIFRSRHYQEADLLAKMLTQELGIVSLIVKGALRPKSKLAGAATNFSRGCFVLATNGHGLANLRTYKQVAVMDHLYHDIQANAYASYILDLVDHAFLEYQQLANYYDLTIWALTQLDRGTDPEIITQIMQLKLLAAYGVAPQLSHCVLCQQRQGPFDYSIKYGGILCPKHQSSDPGRMHLPPQATAVLRTMGLIPTSRLGKVAISPELKQTTRHAIDRIYLATVDLNLKTKKFLDELRLLQG
ncbi:MAG: DNA repair protein RecO [Lactobacillus sp.]|nr:DNA repair protein RecO [Lactobacillus sp.]MDN6043044.1 DNA repair protein RecO [Lactobacillus sp.]MDN6053220.1 DNA repair protein RecO [Lactobacillus sp.]